MEPPTLRSLVTTGPWRERLRWAVRFVTPWGIEAWFWQGNARRFRRRLRAQLSRPLPPRESRYEASIRFLADRGLDEGEVREGSMPEATLRWVADLVLPSLPRGRPTRALHIGNFVGVSLCFFSSLLSEQHPESLMVSIDPDIPHRRIAHPLEHAEALLAEFNLLSRNLILIGYSLERGEPMSDEEHLESIRPEQVLQGLHDLQLTFDLVVMDGNHDGGYVARELAAVRRMLAPGGIVVMDDIRDWPGVRALFSEMRDDLGWRILGEDGRAGVAEMRTA